MDETTPTMQDFNFGVSYMLIAFNCKTHNDLETMYFKSLTCHPNCLEQVEYKQAEC